MTNAESSPVRIRREPPHFRRVAVGSVAPVGPRLVRVTLTGPELAGLIVDEPAASVRMLLPRPGTRELVMPAWNGNEFLAPDGSRPILRTLTPRHIDATRLELDVDIVVHAGGTASAWALSASPGDAAAISGPGRGYAIVRDAHAFVLGGDETAIPAISQLLEALPAAAVGVVIEVAHPDGRLALPDHPNATIEWLDLTPGAPPGDGLVAAVNAVDLDPDTRVWVAGEAAAVQRIRKHLFGVARTRALTTVRGYWKHGRAGDGDDSTGNP